VHLSAYRVQRRRSATRCGTRVRASSWTGPLGQRGHGPPHGPVEVRQRGSGPDTAPPVSRATACCGWLAIAPTTCSRSAPTCQ